METGSGKKQVQVKDNKLISVDRYVVNQFDGGTFIVVDEKEKREICICGNYDEIEDAEVRAQNIAFLLNHQDQL